MPAIKNTFRIILRFYLEESVIPIGARTVFRVYAIGNRKHKAFRTAGNIHRIVGIALQTGQLERFVRIGHAVGGRNMYAHFRSDADGQQAHGELLPVGLHGERVGQGRSGESSVGIDRTGRRQHVVVGGEGDVFRGLVGAQSELHPDTGHQRPESQRNGQDRRCLVDHERGLAHGREHKVVGGQIRRAVSIAPRMREGLVYGVERGGAEGIVGCGARVAADGHAAREGRGRARPVGREFADLRRGTVVERYGDLVACDPGGRRAVNRCAGFAGSRVLGDGHLNIFPQVLRSGNPVILAACTHADCGKSRYNQ